MFKFILFFILSLLFIGCNSAQPTIPIEKKQKCSKQGMLAPSWVCDNSIDNYISVVGYSRKDRLGRYFSRQNSLKNGIKLIKTKMINFLNIKINEKLDLSSLMDKVEFENIKNFIISENIKDIEIRNVYYNKLGSTYTSIYLSKDIFNRSIDRNFKLYFSEILKDNKKSPYYSSPEE